MSKPQLRWTNQGAASDFEAARKYLSLIASDAKVSALVKNLRKTKIVDHAAKDLLRAAELPLLPRDDPHVDEDLKKSTRESRWRQFLLFAATSPSDSRSSWRTAITGSARSVISTRARPFAAASQAGGGDRESATRVKRCPPMSRRPTPASSCTRSSSNRWASASMRWQSHSCHPQPHQRHPPPATGHHGGHCAAPPQWFMNMQSNG